MTLGQKMACYRKLAGMTQQQLGAHLNLSAQAISKWEKDLSEPDISTLRALAELYKITVDELLDPAGGFPATATPEAEDEPAEPEAEESQPPAPLQPLGFCKRCGAMVNEENVGSTNPVVLCKKCAQAKAAELAAAERRRKAEALMAQRRRQEEERQAAPQKKKRQRNLSGYHILSFAVAGLVAAVFLAIGISVLVDDYSTGFLVFMLIDTYVIFSYVCCLFYDCIVQDILVDFAFKSVRWPGLIFTFDLDGCLWLIGMKILFFVLGLLIGLFTTVLGIIVGMVCAPFVFPFQL